MTEDLAPILEGWDHSYNELSARKIAGADGRPKVQMRLELGLVQMEWDGRPDGARPHGQESLLQHLENQARLHELTHPPDQPYELDEETCAKLQQEGIQYYYRYLCLLHLGEYKEAARDTARNLRMFDFVSKYATKRELAWAFEQYRPYVLMMNTRAKAMLCLEAENYQAALGYVDQGIRRIKQFLAEHNDISEDDCSELGYLLGWRKEIDEIRGVGLLTASPEEHRLKGELEEAVATENYEQAARIRDALERLRGG